MGQRALGNRSILADPRSSETIKLINKRLNERFWMPFTPTLLRKYQNKYLINKKNFTVPL